MKRPGPIEVRHLFPETREKLLALLAGLSAADWEKPTVCAGWTVKDIASHLLGGEVGILSRRRDAFTPPGQSIQSWEELVALINTLNDTWVKATRRMSPRVLCDLLAFTAPQVEGYFHSLDPLAVDAPVNWVSADPAPVWLDLAREYTERWHHQQQIRDAVGQPGLKERRYLAPVLDAFVRALPRTFRNVSAPDGTVVQLSIPGDSGGDWFVVRQAGNWELFLDADSAPAAEVAIDPDDAWRLFTKGLKPAEARQRARLSGDATLAGRVFETISILG